MILFQQQNLKSNTDNTEINTEGFSITLGLGDMDTYS